MTQFLTAATAAHTATTTWSTCTKKPAETFGLFDLARALDSGSDDDIRRELCRYIDDGGYRQDVKKYVNSVDWIAA